MHAPAESPRNSHRAPIPVVLAEGNIESAAVSARDAIPAARPPSSLTV